MKYSIIEKAFVMAILASMLYVMFFMVKIVDHQYKCMAEIIADALLGNNAVSQVSCRPETYTKEQ